MYVMVSVRHHHILGVCDGDGHSVLHLLVSYLQMTFAVFTLDIIDATLFY